MEVFNEQTGKPTKLSIIKDGQELIGELIDWSKFFYSEITDTWMSDDNTIKEVKYLIERREQ